MALLKVFVKIFFLSHIGDYIASNIRYYCPLKMGARFSKKAFTPSR